MTASLPNNVVEIAGDLPGKRAAIEQACAQGQHLAIHAPLAGTVEDARAIEAAVRRAGVKAVVFDRVLAHPFVDRAKALLDDEQLGEIQMIRVKSHLGGASLDPARLADPAFNLFAEAPFDKAAVIEHLLGPIAEVFCYGGPAARLASFKFAAAGRYGVHEAIVSSGLTMKTDGEPTDDVIEVTGTDGILWLRNLTATMVEAPKLMLKRKDAITVWDDRADYDLAGVAAAQRAHFADVIRGKAKPRLTIAQAARAVLVNAATHEAWRTARPVRLANLAPAPA